MHATTKQVAVDAILSQGETQTGHPVADASRMLNKAGKSYSTTEKELLAIVWGTKQFRPYLNGKRLFIVTDHKPFQWMMDVKEPTSRFMR